MSRSKRKACKTSFKTVDNGRPSANLTMLIMLTHFLTVATRAHNAARPHVFWARWRPRTVPARARSRSTGASRQKAAPLSNATGRKCRLTLLGPFPLLTKRGHLGIVMVTVLPTADAEVLVHRLVLDRVGLDWTGLGWTWTGLVRTGPDRVGLVWRGLDWAGLD